jgi:hypothetical protein
MGHVHLYDVISPHEFNKDAAIGLGTGSVDLVGPSQEYATLNWNITSDASSARLLVNLQAFGGLGSSGDADATIRFSVDTPVTYRLTLNFPEYGTRSDGSIDGTKLSFFSSVVNPEPPGIKEIEGTLSAGEHVFVASNAAGQGRSNPLRSTGSVTLNVVAVPLPAAVYPGLAVLMLMGWCGWRRRVRAGASCS